ncbi:DsbA family protein [Sorangium sp. So ce131]|uniref:DsbA family protein n=1 Tax=Sorangium sp. So ce131 TaxID=3133282 RepID=UPI003F5FF3D8
MMSRSTSFQSTLLSRAAALGMVVMAFAAGCGQAHDDAEIDRPGSGELAAPPAGAAERAARAAAAERAVRAAPAGRAAHAPAVERTAQAAPAEDAARAAAGEAEGCGAPEHACDCAARGAGADLPEQRTVEAVEVGAAPTRGPADAPVTLVIFADFECLFCAKASRTLKALEAEYQGKLRIAFKHRPLPIHPGARPAARASLAAHAQGKFWEFHDALFASPGALDDASLERVASKLGLDLGRFRRAMRSSDIEAAVAADDAEATRLKLAGTPTMFVNGRRIIGAQPAEVIREVIDEALAAR